MVSYVKRLVRKRKAPKPRVDFVNTKKISRTAAAKSLLELHATLCKTDKEMLVVESLLSLGNDCYKTSQPPSDNLTEPTANIEPLYRPESPNDNQDSDNNVLANTLLRPQNNPPQNVSTLVYQKVINLHTVYMPK